MPKITQAALKNTLTRKLSLKSPEFRLRKSGAKIYGNVISQSFLGKRDHKRQEMIWEVLEAEYGKDAYEHIGMLLAYTPAEWYIDDIMTDRPKSKAS
jgi:acid stress-induced BolA-like protein IbaG/YrbA